MEILTREHHRGGDSIAAFRGFAQARPDYFKNRRQSRRADLHSNGRGKTSLPKSLAVLGAGATTPLPDNRELGVEPASAIMRSRGASRAQGGDSARHQLSRRPPRQGLRVAPGRIGRYCLLNFRPASFQIKGLPSENGMPWLAVRVTPTRAATRRPCAH